MGTVKGPAITITMRWPLDLIDKVASLLKRVEEMKGIKITRTEFTLQAIKFYLAFLAKQESDQAILKALEYDNSRL